MDLFYPQKIKARHYKYMQTVLQKHGFYTRTKSHMPYIKAIMHRRVYGTNWRSVAQKYRVDYSVLYRFYMRYKQSGVFDSFFLYLKKYGIIIVSKQKSVHNIESLDNKISKPLLPKTQRQRRLLTDLKRKNRS